MLTYADVHLRYTLPAIVTLALIARPFVNRSEVLKIAFISTVAVLYTTPWDNYIILNGAWNYSPDSVMAVVGYVPVEEYAFFVAQTALTALWTLLCVRWSTPCTSFNYDASSYRLIRWIPIAALVAAAAVGYQLAVPGRPTFYLGCMLAWMCPVLAFMWYGGGNYFVRKIFSSSVAVAVPTVYLCWVDRIAISKGVWHVAEATSLNAFVVDHLPVEEALFFFVTNVMIVLGANCYDKARGMAETYTSDFPLRFSLNRGFMSQMFRAFVTAECSMPSDVADDIKTSMEIISEASKSFSTASYLFPSGIRLDLIILYAFCRVTDDMIDDESDAERKKHKYDVIERFVNELFADRKCDRDVKTVPCVVNIDWTRYRSELTGREMASFRAVSRIAFYLPKRPFDELLAGYRWDIEGRLVKNEDDLLLYSSYVAGSVGALCVYVMMYRCYSSKHDLADDYDYVIDKAQQMGRVLQMVNIARDIVTDSETLGRCYVPTEYMDNEEEEVRILCSEKMPRALGDKKLMKYSKRMIKLAELHQSESVGAIRCLPRETRGSVLAATDIYSGLTSAIQSSSTYPTRASLSKFHKILIGFYALYVKSIQYVI